MTHATLASLCSSIRSYMSTRGSCTFALSHLKVGQVLNFWAAFACEVVCETECRVGVAGVGSSSLLPVSAAIGGAAWGAALLRVTSSDVRQCGWAGPLCRLFRSAQFFHSVDLLLLHSVKSAPLQSDYRTFIVCPSLRLESESYELSWLCQFLTHLLRFIIMTK